MTNSSHMDQIFAAENRADPYRFYSALRSHAVSIDEGNLSKGPTYVLSRYRDVAALLQDPRLSSDARKRGCPSGQHAGGPTFFSELDDPEHAHHRSLAMQHFGPPCKPTFIRDLSTRIEEIADSLLDKMADKDEIDFVEDFAYALPILAICHVLGVPHEDEGKFHKWIKGATSAVPRSEQTGAQKEALKSLSEYIGSLVAARRKEPADDLISGLVSTQKESGLRDEEIIMMVVALLAAGHETTVNLIANGILTLLRHPEETERLRNEPELIIPAVEELMRLEPPAQIVPGRLVLDDIVIDDTTIPKGATLAFAIAAANRDPERFDNPDMFIPDRANNAHVGFGGGTHYCFGAPLARLEGQIALRAFVLRVINPRLTQDPPPYRESAVLRGPVALPITIDGIR